MSMFQFFRTVVDFLPQIPHNHKRDPQRKHRALRFEKFEERVYLAADLVGVDFNCDEHLDWGGKADIEFDIANYGNRSSGRFDVDLYLSTGRTISKNDYLLDTVRVSSIGANSVIAMRDDYDLPNSPPHRFTWIDRIYVGMIVDADDDVNESDEGNNRNEGNGEDRDRVRIYGTPTKADLFGTLFSVKNGSLEWGSAADIEMHFENGGGVPSGNFAIGLYLSSDSTIGTTDYRLATVPVASVDANTVVGIREQYVLPDTPPAGFKSTGTVYIGMRIDPAYVVVESDKANNSNVGIGIDSDAVSISLPHDGDSHDGDSHDGDSYEVDNTWQEAMPIAVNTSPQIHSIHKPKDVDWVTFTLERSANVVINTNGVAGGDTRMWLYGSNPAGRYIEYDNNGGYARYACIERNGRKALAPGTYFVRIEGRKRNTTIESYTLSVETTLWTAEYRRATLQFYGTEGKEVAQLHFNGAVDSLEIARNYRRYARWVIREAKRQGIDIKKSRKVLELEILLHAAFYTSEVYLSKDIGIRAVLSLLYTGGYGIHTNPMDLELYSNAILPKVGI